MSPVRPSYLLAHHQAGVDDGEAAVVERGAQPPHRRRRQRTWRRRRRCGREAESGHVVQTPREDGADPAHGDHEEIVAHRTLTAFYLSKNLDTDCVMLA